MIVIENTILSEDLFEKKFTCHLKKCKGACCIKGDRGAPLDEDEIDIIAEILPKIIPFMEPSFAEDVKKRGFYEVDTIKNWLQLANLRENVILWYTTKRVLPNVLLN